MSIPNIQNKKSKKIECKVFLYRYISDKLEECIQPHNKLNKQQTNGRLNIQLESKNAEI